MNKEYVLEKIAISLTEAKVLGALAERVKKLKSAVGGLEDYQVINRVLDGSKQQLMNIKGYADKGSRVVPLTTGEGYAKASNMDKIIEQAKHIQRQETAEKNKKVLDKLINRAFSTDQRGTARIDDSADYNALGIKLRDFLKNN